jgi:PAS domain S-box-containing protein
MKRPPATPGDDDPLPAQPGFERFLLDQVEAAVVSTDAGGLITTWNRFAEELLGHPAEKALGASFVELLVAGDEREVIRGILESLASGDSWQGEVDVVANDGGTIPVRMRASPLFDPSGAFVGTASVLVDITEFRRVDRRRAAQYAVSRVLAEAETLADATPRLLEAVGLSLEWEVGAIWVIDPRHEHLRCVDTWVAPLSKVSEFVELSRETTFEPGAGLPGRVWSSGEPTWIADVALDDNFPRGLAAAREGLHGALAFPILLGGEVLGVLEFFSKEIREPDHDLLAMMSSIGSQLGLFIERRVAEEERLQLLSAEEAALEQAERTREQLEFLAEAGAVLTSSLDYGKTMNKLVKLAVPRIAHWCSVEILEEGEIRPVAVAHADPALVDRTWELRRRWRAAPGSPIGPAEVIRTGTSQLFERISDDELREAARDDEHLEMMRALGFSAAMIVPLRARGRTFGAVTFISSDPGRTYGSADLALAEGLAERAAQAADNARLYQERARVARALQQSLLPQRLPRLEWMEIAARYRAAGEVEVGGDFYDVFEAADGAWFAAIGDVQGKGPEAAAVTGLARYTIRAAAVTERVPSRILRTLNQAILNEWTDRFATVSLARIRRSRRGAELAVSCGGHPLPYVLRSSGELETAECKGNLLGAFEEVQLSDHGIKLRPGDAVVMYTDGVTEEHKGKRVFGEDRLVALLRELVGSDAETIAGRIEQAVLDFGEPEPRDDMAVLVLRLPPLVAESAQPV